MEQCPDEGARCDVPASHETQHKLAELVTRSFSSRAQSSFAHCARWLVYQPVSQFSVSSTLRHSQLRKPAQPAAGDRNCVRRAERPEGATSSRRSCGRATAASRYVEVGGSGGNGWTATAVPGPGDRRFFSGGGLRSSLVLGRNNSRAVDDGGFGGYGE